MGCSPALSYEQPVVEDDSKAAFYLCASFIIAASSYFARQQFRSLKAVRYAFAQVMTLYSEANCLKQPKSLMELYIYANRSMDNEIVDSQYRRFVARFQKTNGIDYLVFGKHMTLGITCYAIKALLAAVLGYFSHYSLQDVGLYCLIVSVVFSCYNGALIRERLGQLLFHWFGIAAGPTSVLSFCLQFRLYFRANQQYFVGKRFTVQFSYKTGYTSFLDLEDRENLIELLLCLGIAPTARPFLQLMLLTNLLLQRPDGSRGTVILSRARRLE